MKAFPEHLKETNRNGRILFRVDKESDKLYPSVLIQSILCPDWGFLINNDQYLLKDPVFKQFKYPKFAKGNKYRFRIFGNPTKKINGKRVGMYKEEEQYNWLKRKAELGGFNLIQVNITRKEELSARVNNRSSKMTFHGVQFEGMLQIANPEKFETTMRNGIGSGKSFGFGFLTISKF